MADDFYSFDEALEELKLKEEELKRLVSEGEIRAFRKGDTMKLRRADVETLRAELDGDLVDLGDNADELVFEDETDLGGDTGMATQELDVETLVDDGVEEVAELELDDIEEPSPRRSSTRSGSAPIKRQSAVAAATAEEEEEPGWVKGAAIVSALVLFLSMPIVVSLLTGNASGLAKGIAGIFGQTFEEAAAPAGGVHEGRPPDGRPTSVHRVTRTRRSASRAWTSTRSTRARRPIRLPRRAAALERRAIDTSRRRRAGRHRESSGAHAGRQPVLTSTTTRSSPSVARRSSSPSGAATFRPRMRSPRARSQRAASSSPMRPTPSPPSRQEEARSGGPARSQRSRRTAGAQRAAAATKARRAARLRRSRRRPRPGARRTASRSGARRRP